MSRALFEYLRYVLYAILTCTFHSEVTMLFLSKLHTKSNKNNNNKQHNNTTSVYAYFQPQSKSGENN